MTTNHLAEKIKYDISSINYNEHTLDNGLRVIMCKFGSIPVVALNTTFHIGSKDEDENKTGLAHLFEHLMFEGSPNIPKGKFDEILNQNGGDSNAYTSWDSTSYYMTIPSHKLETAMWLDSDRIYGFGISQESLEVQKDVVFEEKLLSIDNSPYGTVEEESSKRLFKQSGYRWPIIGNMEDLRKVNVRDLKDFFERFYSPNNAVISVVGDIDYDKTLKLMEKYYGAIKPGKEIKRRNFCEDDIVEEMREDIFDNIQLEGKFIFYRLPEMGTKDYYAMNILNGILSEGDSSRFYHELEYKDELVTEIDSNLYGMEKTSLYIISAIAMKGRCLGEIENKIDAILNDMREGKINEDEIIKIKNRIETYYNSKRQSIVSLADKFSSLKTFYNDCEKINFEILDYLSVTKRDIVETANKYLNNNQRLILNYLPKK
ncbi:MAG: insulinase family protein [Bacteroidota bacterium]|nr:insulinase family protein [Bacteroidota bacterium]